MIMEFFIKMKIFIILLGALTLTFAIQVPSTWQQGDSNEKVETSEIRPSNDDSVGIDARHPKPQIVLIGSYSHPVPKNNWAPVIHQIRRNSNILVKQNYVNYGKPHINANVKKPISRQPFKPSYPERSNLEFYLPPKMVSPFSTSLPKQRQQPFHSQETNLRRIQPITNFVPFAQSRIAHEQSPRPNTYSSFTNRIPSFADIDRFSEHHRLQTVKQVASQPGFTTSVPPVQNFDQNFNIPPRYKAVESLQRNRFSNHVHNNFVDGNTKKPAYNQAVNTRSSVSDTHTQNIAQDRSVQSPPQYENHLYKNYRDDRTHEPIDFDPFFEPGGIPEVEREESEKAPISSHEYPADIPTKPIYPGPGRWAKPGVKHRPFISKQKYDKLEETEETPDGYDTFIEGEKLFKKLNGKFRKGLSDFPERHKVGQFLEKKISNSETEEKPQYETEAKTEHVTERQVNDKEENLEDEEEEEKEFIPTRLYAQVRHSEGIEHLPASEAEEPRLKEAIKESKIQTVYTEEGYEDSAYDHGGHEKEAENEEGFEEVEKVKEEVSEKKVPAQKYNLHLRPKYESTSYGDEKDLPTDEEIEQYKREEFGIVDSDEAGSRFGVSTNSVDDTDEVEIPEEHKMKSSNNFISTKEVKTMTTMENDDGDTKTEISSRVKVILQPNNQTRTHEYVKIYPKVYKGTSGKKSNRSKVEEEIIAKVEEVPSQFGENSKNENGIYIEEIITSTTDIPITTVPPSESTDIFTEEIPITTLATTALPSLTETSSKENIPETLESIEKAIWGIPSKLRKKRFTNDFPKIQVDTDFISKISHDLGNLKEEPVETKYPYYHKTEKDGMNENSPLKYSENLNNIPLKKKGNMAFYEQAESMTECPEIDTTVEPIPERIQNADKNDDETDEDYDEDEEDEVSVKDGNGSKKSVELPQQPKTPRLTGLGDKIDCLKVKYFGINPFDSPLFAEETVGAIKPIFNVFQNRKQNNKGLTNERNESAVRNGTTDNHIFSASGYGNDIHNEVVSSKSKQNSIVPLESTTTYSPITINIEKLRSDVLDDITNNMKTNNQTETPAVQTVSTISLLTTPQYTVDLKPKHIYDQIKLLNHLPNKQNSSGNQTESNIVQLISNVEVKEVSNKSGGDNSRQAKTNDDGDNLTYDSSIASPIILNNLTHDPPEEGALLPDAEALRRRRKFKTRRKQPIYPIFGIKRSQLTTSFPIFESMRTASTVLPKYKVVSEVFYKDDIKPNEQLNVFTDILNNIRNSSQEAADETFQVFTKPVSAISGSRNGIDQSKISREFTKDSYLKAYSDQEVDSTYYSSTVTSTTSTVRPDVHKYMTLSNDGMLHTVLPNDKYRLYMALMDAKNKRNSGLITNSPDINFEEKNTRVVGMTPPGIHRYKTINHPKRDNQLLFTNPGTVETKIMNNFLVMGMKPPPKQKVFVYSEFEDRNFNRNRRVPSRRGKRSTNRGSYAQLTRNQGQDETAVTTATDDDDDYVPHRPKNYYYDEKTGKIVYNNDKKSEEENDEEIEYIEVVEEPPKISSKSKPKQDPIFATATPPPEGQSYIDFVNKLKSAPDYKFIPDPTTTEKGAEVSTEKVTLATVMQDTSELPEYLSILGKVRENSEYKFIPDKKDKEKTVITTSEAPKEIAEEGDEEEISPANVKNSPGGVQHDLPQGFQIFDISDYIPKLKNYLPRTSVDTSKYQTIRRPTVAPNSNSETDSGEDEGIQTVKDSNENENSQTSNSNNEPVFIHTRKPEEVTDTIKKEIVTESPSIIVTTTASKLDSTPISQIRRRRPTTVRSVTTRRFIATTSLAPVVVPEIQTEHHQKARRNYRRRPTRIKAGTSPVAVTNDDLDDTTRVLRRRSNLYERKTSENGTVSPTLRNINNILKTEPKKYVEIIKKYNQNKRHGGHYRKNDGDETNPSQSLIEPTPEASRKSKDVEIIGEYNKDQTHGGNYRREHEDSASKEIDEDMMEKTTDEALIVNLMPEFANEDRDNSESVRVETTTQKINDRRQKPKRIIIKQKRNQNEQNKHVQRLTDVVTKPETFYSDPTLPKSINMLVGIDTLSSEEVKKIEGVQSSSEEIVEESVPQKIETLPDTSTTRKPAFIKDPGRRLYYYAPI